MGDTNRRAIRHLGVLIYPNQEFGRRVLTGVVRHVDTTPAMDVELFQLNAFGGGGKGAWADLNRLDGVLAVAEDSELPRLRKRLDIPMVSVPKLMRDKQALAVGPDPHQVGATGAEYLSRLGLTNLTVYGISRRVDGAFVDMIAGFAQWCDTHGEGALPAKVFVKEDEHGLDRWLRQLPKPLGVLAKNDLDGAHLLDRARACGLRVPEDVAVLGIGDDPLVCTARRTGLSSIRVPAEEAGWRACAALVELMNGVVPDAVQLSPLGVSERNSTRFVCLADATIGEAVQYIRSHFAEPLATDEIAAVVDLPRRSLERRFRAAVGHTIHEELVRCRTEHAKRLLATTDLPIKAISRAVGEDRPHHFSRFFKKYVGSTPSQWRDQRSDDALG